MGKHYVPQEYLRGFSSDAKRSHIWMFDKVTREWSEPAIRRAAQERDYFAADIEKRLANEIEGPGHIAINKLRTGSTISLADRESLAMYIAVLIMRVPRKRRKAQELVPSLIAKRLTETREGVEDLRTDSNTKRIDSVLAELERIERSYSEELPETVEELIDSPWPSPLVLAAVRTMHWRFLDAPGNQFFITSDNPAHYFDSRGLGNDDAELTVPLGAQLAIMGTHQGMASGNLRFAAPAKLVKELNRRQSFAAERFVFSPSKEKWIERVSLRPHAKYVKTIWSAPV